jgi:hypothetical protein
MMNFLHKLDVSNDKPYIIVVLLVLIARLSQEVRWRIIWISADIIAFSTFQRFLCWFGKATPLAAGETS